MFVDTVETNYYSIKYKQNQLTISVLLNWQEHSDTIDWCPRPQLTSRTGIGQPLR